MKTTVRYLLSVMLAVALIPAHSAYAADAGGSVNEVIKNNPEIAALDQQVTAAYRQRYAEVDKDTQDLLHERQKRWREMRDRFCARNRGKDSDPPIASTVAACLTTADRNRMSWLTDRCQTDKSHTVEDMAKWSKPWSDKIPLGFKIEDRFVGFVITPDNLINIKDRSLPLKDTGSKHSGLLGYGYKEIAQCSTLGPDGQVWLVTRHLGGGLSYIPKDQTMTLAAYKEKILRDNATWTKRHKD